MHVCKRSLAQHSAALALPRTSEQTLSVPEFGGTKEARNTWREKKKKGKCMCTTVKLLQRMLQLLVCGTSNCQDFQQSLSCFLHLQSMPKYLIFAHPVADYVGNFCTCCLALKVIKSLEEKRIDWEVFLG